MMPVVQRTLNFRTRGRGTLDITAEVEHAVRESGVRTGLCNVFLQHQIALWRLAHELNVPVVDLALHFQAHDGEALFMDPAHPNTAGHRLIADALWSALERAEWEGKTPSSRLR